jgi:hypothetical protein
MSLRIAVTTEPVNGASIGCRGDPARRIGDINVLSVMLPVLVTVNV